MIPLSLATLLGVRIDGVDPSPLVGGAYMASAIMLLCAFWLRAGPAGNRIAMAAMLLATGAAVYSHDVVNLPEIVCVAVIGGCIGLLLARRCTAWAFPWLIVAGHGLLGLAAMATAVALFLNPYAFGLVDGHGAILPGNGMMLVTGFVLGALVMAGAMALAVRRTQAGLPLISGAVGWAAVALGLALGNSVMVIAGGFAGIAAWRSGWRARKIERVA